MFNKFLSGLLNISSRPFFKGDICKLWGGPLSPSSKELIACELTATDKITVIDFILINVEFKLIPPQ